MAIFSTIHFKSANIWRSKEHNAFRSSILALALLNNSKNAQSSLASPLETPSQDFLYRCFHKFCDTFCIVTNKTEQNSSQYPALQNWNLPIFFTNFDLDPLLHKIVLHLPGIILFERFEFNALHYKCPVVTQLQSALFLQYLEAIVGLFVVIKSASERLVSFSIHFCT